MPADAWAKALLPPVDVRPKPGEEPSQPVAAQPDAVPDEAAVTQGDAATEPAAFQTHRAAHQAQQRNAQAVVDNTPGCSFPACFEPSGINAVEAAVVAELVHEVRPCRGLGQVIGAVV